MSQQNIKENLLNWDKFDRYSKWMFHMYEKHIGKNILDIGGGIGTAISYYITEDKQILTTELFSDKVEIMNERGIETLKEVSRILADNGRFVVISRNNAFMRQHRMLEPFGFTEKETLEILKGCRMYSDLNSLDEICDSLAMKLISRKEYKDNENIAFSVSEYKKQLEI